MPRPLDRIPILLARIRGAVRRPEPEALPVELQEQRPEDIADALERMPQEEALETLTQMAPGMAAEVLAELTDETADSLIEDLPDATVAYYLDVLPMDDALDLAEGLEPERLESLLMVIPDEDAAEIRRLMRYPKDSVGRAITERFFEVGPETTVDDLLLDLRLAPEDKYETVNDVYVLDQDRKLLGLFSLRRALRAEPRTKASQLMRSDFESAPVDEEEEDAARRMARYGFYALPVLDEEGRMVGIFTGDDAQEILRDAESKDVLALGAVSGRVESYLSLSVWKLVQRRAPWLLVLFVAESLTGFVLRHYGQNSADTSGTSILALMPFVPLIIGAGGNAGSQVTTTITRALAVNEVSTGDWFTVMRRELATSILIGVLLGVIGMLRARFVWGGAPPVGLIVGISLPCVVLWAAVVGSLLPLGAKRLGVDPAVMSAPFITTFVDATGLVIFFEVARSVLGGGLA